MADPPGAIGPDDHPDIAALPPSAGASAGLGWPQGRLRVSPRSIGVVHGLSPVLDITHPREAEGRAARLWPDRGREVDFAALVPVPRRDTVWTEGPRLSFTPGTYEAGGRRPLGAGWDPMFEAPPGVVFASTPWLA